MVKTVSSKEQDLHARAGAALDGVLQEDRFTTHDLAAHGLRPHQRYLAAHAR
jgi:hypothetical protein